MGRDGRHVGAARADAAAASEAGVLPEAVLTIGLVLLGLGIFALLFGLVILCERV